MVTTGAREQPVIVTIAARMMTRKIGMACEVAEQTQARRADGFQNETGARNRRCLQSAGSATDYLLYPCPASLHARSHPLQTHVNALVVLTSQLRLHTGL
jgi:hypothetical protein